MTVSKILPRAFLAALTLASGLAATAPSAMASNLHAPKQTCIKVLGIKVLCFGK
jgi:hypothetical protein